MTVGAVLLGGLAIAALSACATPPDARIDKAYAMARHPGKRNLDRIEALLSDPDRDVRATSLVIMDALDGERAKRMAAIAISDADGLVRAAAVSIVAKDADPAAVALLARLASEDPVWQVRARALDAIANSDDPIARDSFTRALSDPVRHVRRAALRAGGDRPGLLPVDRLAELVVSDSDWENRVDAARALGASNDPAAYPPLEAALADPNEFVRMSAERGRKALASAGVVR